MSNDQEYLIEGQPGDTTYALITYSAGKPAAAYVRKLPHGQVEWCAPIPRAHWRRMGEALLKLNKDVSDGT